MSDPSKHHYIPVFYLRQWATGGFLCEMRKIRGKVVVRSKAPDGTGYQKNLYKIDGIPAEIAQHFERQFMHMVDTEAASAMRKIPLGQAATWSVKERDAWVRFMLSLIFRNPEAVTLLKEQIKKLWDESINSIRDNYDAHRQAGDPDTSDEFIAKMDPHGATISASNFLQNMMNNESVASGMIGLRWGCIKFPDSRYTLVTSDRPLDMPSLGQKDSYIALPIGPRTMFVATKGLLDLKNLSRDRQAEIVRQLNEKTVRQARQYVWALDDGSLDFVRRYICTLPDRQLISQAGKDLAEKQARGEESRSVSDSGS